MGGRYRIRAGSRLFHQFVRLPELSDTEFFLEKSLLVGDYLFVSKLSYGPRVPNTPISFPLVQNTLPILNCKSYLDWPEWGYKRVKGLGHVKRNDIVVFNFPAGGHDRRESAKPGLLLLGRGVPDGNVSYWIRPRSAR